MRPFAFLFLFNFALSVTADAAAIKPSADAIEARATCITHEGADLPVGAAPRQKPVQPDDPCAAAKLDGTICEPLEAAEARACRLREIALWDAVLDRLVASEDRRRRTAVKTAIAAFRQYRDRTCAAYQAIAINPLGPDAVAGCRLSETARFADRLYINYYSP